MSASSSKTQPPDARSQRRRSGRQVSVATVVDPPWAQAGHESPAFALGGAGLVLGGVTRRAGHEQAQQAGQRCPGGVCGPSQKADFDSYHTLGMLSTIGFVAGGVGAGAGVVLLLVRPPDAGRAAASRSRKAKVQELRVVTRSSGVASAGVEGTF